MTDLHTRIANRCNAQGIMITAAGVAAVDRELQVERYRTNAPFAPATGFIPGDGDEPGVSFARDNPLNNTPRDLGEGQGKGMGLGVHAVANNSNLERNND